jgi:hypothetical protein
MSFFSSRHSVRPSTVCALAHSTCAAVIAVGGCGSKEWCVEGCGMMNVCVEGRVSINSVRARNCPGLSLTFEATVRI